MRFDRERKLAVAQLSLSTLFMRFGNVALPDH